MSNVKINKSILDEQDLAEYKELEKETKDLVKLCLPLLELVVFAFIGVPICIGVMTHSAVIGVLSIVLAVPIIKICGTQFTDIIAEYYKAEPELERKIDRFNDYIERKYNKET